MSGALGDDYSGDERRNLPFEAVGAIGIAGCVLKSDGVLWWSVSMFPLFRQRLLVGILVQVLGQLCGPHATAALPLLSDYIS